MRKKSAQQTLLCTVLINQYGFIYRKRGKFTNNFDIRKELTEKMVSNDVYIIYIFFCKESFLGKKNISTFATYTACRSNKEW